MKAAIRVIALAVMTLLLASCDIRTSLSDSGQIQSASPSALTPSESTTEPTAQPDATPQTGGPLMYEMKTRSEQTDYDEKQASYPETGIAVIDEDARSIVDNAFAEEVGYEGMEGESGYVGVSATVERNDGIIFCVVYELHSYYAGAAHGTTGYIVKNYSMPDAAPIALDDLFADDDYVMRLSTLAEDQLRNLEIDMPEEVEWLDEDSWFYEGVAADKVNFQSFVPRENGLQFIYGSYGVAPYAVGTVKLTMPWEKLHDIMSATWRERVEIAPG